MDKVINLKIQTELHEKLKAKAQELHVSMGAIVRIALSEYLKKGE